MCEPEWRIRIQSDDPTPTRSGHSLTSVRVASTKVNEALSVGQTDLPMNVGLVAVTGGRGAGKTALVDLVANCFTPRIDAGNESSFVARIAEDCSEIPVSISFMNGEEYARDTIDEAGHHPAKPFYIAQGDLHHQVTDEGGFHAHVWSLIRDNPRIRDSVALSESQDIRSQITRLNAEIKRANDDILRLESETTNDIARDIEVTLHEQQVLLKDLDDQILQSAAQITDDEEARAQTLEKQRGEQKRIQDVCKELQEKLHALSHFLSENVPAINVVIENANTYLAEIGFVVSLPKVTYEPSEPVQALRIQIEETAQKAVTQIQALQAESESFEDTIRAHNALLARREEAADATKGTEAARDGLAASKRELTRCREERDQAVANRVQCWIRLRDKERELTDAFPREAQAVLRDLEFSVDLQFDRDAMSAAVMPLVDKRSTGVVPDGDDLGLFRDLFPLLDEIEGGADDASTAYCGRLEALLGTKLLAQGTRQALLDALYGDYLSTVPTVRYKGTPLPKLSLGQKATVLLKIYLAQGDQPIIIDSHDDYLDNAFIMDELVVALRNAKQERQIVMVSNNGNVVINSDAEQIVLAHRSDDGEISYTSGAIENPDIRAEALRVLEGGEEAFRQRQRQYRLEHAD